MQCIHPRLIKNPAWNAFDRESIQSFQVPCGHCIACRIARTREWSIRLLHELSSWEDGVFITLTYDEDHLPEGNTLVKKDLQNFYKRLRKRLDKEYGRIEYFGTKGEKKHRPAHPIKNFSCGEYGERYGRPHYHGIIFGMSPKEESLIRECWPFGFVKVGTVTYDSCKYVAGYVQKKLYGDKADEVYKDRTPPFLVCSEHIGLDYINRNRIQLLENRFITINGVKLGLPRYYRLQLGIDTQDYYNQTAEYREEFEEKMLDRAVREVGIDAPKGVVEHEVVRQKYISQEQYGKNLEALLTLHDRDKL